MTLDESLLIHEQSTFDTCNFKCEEEAYVAPIAQRDYAKFERDFAAGLPPSVYAANRLENSSLEVSA